MSMKFTYTGVAISGIQTRKDATDILNRMLEIVEDYGYATVADLKDLSDIAGSYTDNKLQWAKANIVSAHISEDNDGTYRISLPAPTDTPPNYRRVPSTYRDTTAYSKVKHTKDPINITIDIKELDDPANTLAEVFKYVYTIEDRVVNISIQ